MVGSDGERILRTALPHVDVWNSWYEWYGNTPEGFAALNVRVSALAEEAGRSPDEIARSACVLVRPDPMAEERPVEEETPALTGGMERIAEGLRNLATAGADEAILVVDPITERSIRDLGKALALLDR